MRKKNKRVNLLYDDIGFILYFILNLSTWFWYSPNILIIIQSFNINPILMVFLGILLIIGIGNGIPLIIYRLYSWKRNKNEKKENISLIPPESYLSLPIQNLIIYFPLNITEGQICLIVFILILIPKKRFNSFPYQIIDFGLYLKNWKNCSLEKYKKAYALISSAILTFSTILLLLTFNIYPILALLTIFSYNLFLYILKDAENEDSFRKKRSRIIIYLMIYITIATIFYANRIAFILISLGY